MMVLIDDFNPSTIVDGSSIRSKNDSSRGASKQRSPPNDGHSVAFPVFPEIQSPELEEGKINVEQYNKKCLKKRGQTTVKILFETPGINRQASESPKGHVQKC